MRPRLTHRFRVATVVPGAEDDVLVRLAGLPSTIRARTISTSAGVVVTLEQERRGLLAWRRRTVRSLLRQLDLVARGTTRIDASSAELSGARRPVTDACQLAESSTTGDRTVTESTRLIA
jgi:hypothetical protein